MAIVAADWTVTRSTGNIRYIGAVHTGAATYATVIEFHRFLQALADDAVSAPASLDELDITDENPSARSTDNIIRLLGNYNIDATASEHLYDGSIIQGAGGTEEIYDGIVNYGNSDVQIQIHQNGAVIATDWWNLAGAGLNPDAAQGISHRFMLPVRTAGADIDGRRLLGTTRTFGNTYAEFPINGTSRGNNVLALADAPDLNNETVIGTVAGYTGITNTEGYRLLDIDNNTVNEAYYSEWNTNQPTRTINDFYERMKWLTRDGSVSTLYGLNGELFRGITHEINVDTPTGTFNAFEQVTWGTGATAGVGQMFAINSPTAGTKMWIQLLSGVLPTDGLVITGTTSAATVAMNVTITPRTLSRPFVGVSTGTAIIGSYGLGIEPTDLAATDKLFDLTNTQVTPPNNVTFTVSGLVIGEDRLLVGPWDGAATDVQGNPEIDYNQLTLATNLLGAAETAVVVTTGIPTDTPATGDIRITLDDGRQWEQAYTSWTGSTFTIASTNFSVASGNGGATNPKNVWIAYLDLEATATSHAFTGVYLADRNFVIKDRDGGGTPIKEFIASGVMTNTGGNIAVIRTSDA